MMSAELQIVERSFEFAVRVVRLCRFLESQDRVSRTPANQLLPAEDYIGIKKQMDLALAHYSEADRNNIEEIEASIIVVRDHLDLLARIFHQFDTAPYFSGSPIEQLQSRPPPIQKKKHHLFARSAAGCC